jgi:DNA-binding transcriptional regulator YiaG
MTANPLTPLDALRELVNALDQSEYEFEREPDHAINGAIAPAFIAACDTLDHYTRNGWDGPSVKARRIAAGLSQRDLADATGFGLTTIRNWEQGRSRPSKVSMSVLWPILAQPHEREQS